MIFLKIAVYLSLRTDQILGSYLYSFVLRLHFVFRNSDLWSVISRFVIEHEIFLSGCFKIRPRAYSDVLLCQNLAKNLPRSAQCNNLLCPNIKSGLLIFRIIFLNVKNLRFLKLLCIFCQKLFLKIFFLEILP